MIVKTVNSSVQKTGVHNWLKARQSKGKGDEGTLDILKSTWTQEGWPVSSGVYISLGEAWILSSKSFLFFYGSQDLSIFLSADIFQSFMSLNLI